MTTQTTQTKTPKYHNSRHFFFEKTDKLKKDLILHRLFENIVTKEEIAQIEQFFLLTQCFPLSVIVIHSIKEIFHFLTKYVQSCLLQNCHMRERVLNSRFKKTTDIFVQSILVLKRSNLTPETQTHHHMQVLFNSASEAIEGLFYLINLLGLHSPGHHLTYNTL